MRLNLNNSTCQNGFEKHHNVSFMFYSFPTFVESGLYKGTFVFVFKHGQDIKHCIKLQYILIEKFMVFFMCGFIQ